MVSASKEKVAHVLGDLEFCPDVLEQRYNAERVRRLRTDGPAQYQGARPSGAFASFGADPWADPAFERPPITEHSQVIVVGGGFGGLLSAARLQERGVSDVRVVEVAGDFGGTWY